MGFHSSVVYQIYPKSFRDSNGDGVGDLRGIIQKVDHIASLGVDLVWLNPFYPSPQRDNGYDVSDYCAIDPAMGTMADFEELVARLAEHDIGIMLDMVLNHTSTAHEWFQRALAGEQQYRDYYIIRPPRPDGSLPTSWGSKFGGPAWAPFGATGDYYLHLFDVTQADLDWRNPAVRREMAQVVNFWRGKGVKAFRFDVINLIGKAAELVDGTPGTDGRDAYTDGADVHAYLQELSRESFGQDPDAVTVGEMSSTSIEACVGYSNPDNGELSMVFNFHHLKVDYENGQKWTLVPYDLAALKRILDEWAVGMQAGNGWNALFWNNHDQPRANDRFGDPAGFPVETATMLATVIHLLRGTPYVYMGEEIGMTDPEYTLMSDYVDVEAHNAYAELLATGESAGRAFQIVHSKARDNARTPMQWDDSPTAGFTDGVPWLRPTTQDRINASTSPGSQRILAHYRRLIALRKGDALVSEGRYESFETGHEAVFGYLRSHQGRRLLVLANFRAERAEVNIPEEFSAGQVLIGNHDDVALASRLVLRPYEALGIVAGD